MYPTPAHGVRAELNAGMCAPTPRDSGSSNVAEDVSGGRVKLGCLACVGVCPRVSTAAPPRPLLPKRASNLSSLSALFQPDASFLVPLGVYCKFRD